MGCAPQIKINVLKKFNNEITASLKIGQSEVIGSCIFSTSSQHVNNANFSYLLTFSERVDSTIVGSQIISNLGTGGDSSLSWTVEDCSDGRHFKIGPNFIVGDGTIIPDISNIVMALSTPDKNIKLESNIHQFTIIYDTQVPSVQIEQSLLENIGSCIFSGTNDPTNIAGFSYKIAFSEKINPATFTLSDITNMGTGAGSSLVWELENCGDDQHFKLVVNSLIGDGTVVPVISAGMLTDLAGNSNAISLSVDNSVTYDSSSLLVNINQSVVEVIGSCSFSATTDPTNVAGFSYKVVFSKDINASSFTTNDISNSGTSGDISWSLGSCGDGRTFELVADTIEFNGTIIPFIANGLVLDSIGSGNQASTGIDNTVTFDTIRPSVTINQAITEIVGGCSFTATTDPTHLTGFNYKVIFSENINVSSFVAGDIVNHGTSGLVSWNLESCGNSQVFKLTATLIASDGTVIPVVSANSVSDAAGNLNTVSNSTDNSVTYDSIAPSLTINQSVAETVGSCSFTAANDPANSPGFSYRISFLEPIDPLSFTISDITNIGTGGTTILTWLLENCGDDQNFKLTATSITGNGTIIPRVNAYQVYDVAGNLNTISTSTDNSVTFDTSSPSVTINQSVAETIGSCSFLATNDPTNVAGFSYKVVFSEIINAASFTVADIINNGTGGGATLTWALATCGDNQNFKLTASTVSGDGTIIPTIIADSVSDIAGNLNTLSTATDNSITFDTTSPGVTISRSVVETIGSCSFSATNALEGTPGFSFKLTFSERINNSSFTIADVTNSGTGGATTLTWSLSNCGDDQNYRLTVSAISGEGTVIPQILASRLTDVAGNQNVLSVSSNGTVTYELMGWRQEAYIKAVNNNDSLNFGENVSISDDTLAVGVSRESSNATLITNGPTSSGSNTSTYSGAVYVYKRSGNNWIQEAYIKAVNNGSGDNFGTSVSIKGNTLVVGASGEDSNATAITNGTGVSSGSDSSMYAENGAVYLYRRSGNNWAQEAYIKAINNGSGDNFGLSVSISGETIAVGAPYEDSNATTITNGVGTSGTDSGSDESGAVYVYRRSGSNWAQEAYIKAINNGAGDSFGRKVSLSGETLAVSAIAEDSNATTITNGTNFSGLDSGANNSGAVYIYRRSGNNWAHEAYIKSVNSEAGDAFGQSISLSGDTLAVGTLQENSNATTITNGPGFSGVDTGAYNSGAVYVYRRSGLMWAQEAYIKAVNSSNAAYFGASVSVSGNTLVVGAHQESFNAITITNGTGFSGTRTSTYSGAVYVYKRSGNDWEQEAYIKAANNEAYDYFGQSVSISGDTIAVGAIGESSSGTTITNGTGFTAGNGRNSSGAVYVYRNNARLFNTQDVFKTNVSTTGLTLNWINSGFKTTGYFIAYAEGPNAPANCSSGTVIDVGNNTSYTFNSLSAGTYYSFRICSYDSNANVSEGYVVSFHTSSLLPEPGDLSLSRVTPDREARLTWTSAGGSVTGYRLVYQEAPVAPLTCNSGTSIDLGNVLTYQFTGLLTNTDYGVRVCSYDASGNLSIGKYISIKTSLALEPSNVYTTSTAITNDRLTVHWTNTSDRVTGFIVAWAAGSNAPVSCSAGTVVDVGNITNYLITGLNPGASYGVRVCAYEAGETNTSMGIALIGNVRSDGWVQEAYIKAANSGAGDIFGYSVSISGDTLAVGAFNEDSNATTVTNGTGFSDSGTSLDSGAVYVYKRSGNNWAQEAYIKAVNNGANDAFGYSISISGDTLAVGAFNEDSNATMITNGTGVSPGSEINNTGAVYVYKRTGNNWGQEAYIKAVNSGDSDRFGTSVSISGDTLVVGAPYEDSNGTMITNGTSFNGVDSGANDSGAVYVYKRSGNNWIQEAYIKAVNNGSGDYFGLSTSISGDTLVVGVSREDSSATTVTNGTSFNDLGTSFDSGAVYIYRRSGNNWAQEAYVKAANNGADDYFGQSVSISGNTLAVGAYQEDSNATTITNGTSFSDSGISNNSGAVYVYRRSVNSWAQEAYIKAVNNGVNDSFGHNLSLSDDTLVVGAPYEDSNATMITNGTSFSGVDSGATDSGAVYVYKRSGNNWAQEAYIKAVNNGAGDTFGLSVSISGDTLVVGANSEDSNATTITNGTGPSELGISTNSGAVYVYRNNARIFNTQDVFTSSISQTGFTLNWISAGFRTTGYFIAYAEGPNAPVDCSSGTVINVGNNTSYTFNSLSAGTYYSFRICSYDSSATLSSGYVISFPTASALPEPGDLSINLKSDRAVTINWGNAGGSVTGYRIAYQQGSVAPLTCESGTIVNVGNVLTYEVTGLLTNTDYGVRVCSYDGSGNLSLGKYISTKTTLALEPSHVYTTSTAITNDRLTIHWTNASDRVTGFVVAWAVGSNAPSSCSAGTFTDVGNTTSYLITGLNPGASYGIRICAYEAGGINRSMGASFVGNVRSNGWVQEAYIKASNNGVGDAFGSSASISGDTLVVGAVDEDSNATMITNGTGVSPGSEINNTGAVYVYKRTGNNWGQEAYIKAVNSGDSDRFGTSVSISGDTLVVGAPYEDSNGTMITNGTSFNGVDSGANDSGAVYVYKRSGNNWAQEAYIKAVNNGASDNFGYSISISGDTLAVSAPYEDSNATMITNGTGFSGSRTSGNSGAVYVYKRTGNNWAQEAYIKASNNGVGDAFGYSVSISGDTIAVGAYYEDSNATMITNGTSFSGVDSGATDSGAVYVYKRSGNNWAQEAYIKAANNGAGDNFGQSVSISDNTLAVGAHAEDSNATIITNGTGFSGSRTSSNSGAVYVYKRSGNSWAQEAYIKAANNGSSDLFGHKVSLSGDTLAVVAYLEDSNATSITNGTGFSDFGYIENSGAVYVYRRSGNNWAQEAYIKAVNRAENNYFGSGGVSLSGDTLAVATPSDDSNAITITNGTGFYEAGLSPNSGAVHIYRNNARLFAITEVFSTITSDSIYLKWNKTGGTAIGYGVNFEVGNTTPPLCSLSMDYDLGDNNELLLESLAAGTDYSIRFCVYDSSNQFVEDKIVILRTNP